MSSKLSPLNELLKQQLLVARQLDQQTSQANTAGVMMEIPETGKILSSAYEQLRNAAEYAEEHLLLQRAIKRFLKRNLFTLNRRSHALGTELIVELVQAGYLQGDHFSKATAQKLDQIITEYMTAHGHLRQAHISRDKAMDWVLAIISTEAENTLNPHNSQKATVYFAYHHFLQTISRDQFADLTKNDSYELSMYIAIHQGLLKSDIDIVRHELLDLYKQSPRDTTGFIHLNQQIDHHFRSELTQRLKRIIIRYGAPFRVLKSLLDKRTDAAELLADKHLFMDAYEWQVRNEYQQVQQRLNRGLTKSIIFIFITKVIVGISIEIPYDLIKYGHIAWLPLAVNLLFPPLYMASLKVSLRLPSTSNAHSIRNYMEKLLFSDADHQISVPEPRQSSAVMKLLYSLLFFVPIVITISILQNIGFNVVQIAIFVVFFSTASFLGFRLSTMVRELELTTRQRGLLSSLRDFFYLPFIVSGQWLSRKYGKINAVARFLDIAIELPLKAVLRLLRQWIRFLHEKHEELY